MEILTRGDYAPAEIFTPSRRDVTFASMMILD